jgi:hypothetical protein
MKKVIFSNVKSENDISITQFRDESRCFCITCEESKSLPSLVGKVKKKIDPHLAMYILSLK